MLCRGTSQFLWFPARIRRDDRKAFDMTMIRTETAADVAARERLLDRAFGKARRRKTSERIREGRLPSEGLAFTAVDAISPYQH